LKNSAICQAYVESRGKV